ncbi:hypothetical protein BMWSH_p301 (plasmid) [Priestia megaterium WSH-002]|uniref:Uncharacterized protein n=1 Tax=Priestia megaterium (strain WSH-002) TaxID=1006007 RepID=A0A8D3X7E0_PRIMW|nr:hypothetical protein BMWSH_p301 [Priestia megaterium WSH-002]
MNSKKLVITVSHEAHRLGKSVGKTLPDLFVYRKHGKAVRGL